MLPSTGYFNGINCPFYENGPCDRPYCHFRHARRDLQNTVNDAMESGAILQKLVSAAVQRVLQQTEVSATLTSSQATVVDTVSDINKLNVVTTAKATYNPTPIAELNKINNTDAEKNEDINEQRRRHIPVPYTPRKPASIPIKRPVDTNGSSKPFIYIPPPLKYTPGSSENVPNDAYTPSGTSESKEIYQPGTEKELPEYTPDPTTQNCSSKHNYVPSSDKIVNKKKILEYKPSNPVKSTKSSVTYQPTPRSLAPCFSSDEEEPDTKKRKLSNDLNGLDDLGPEFDILDQILDEEKTTEEVKPKVGTITIKSQSKHSTSDSKEKNGDASKSEKERSHKSHHKSKSDKKEKPSLEDKDKKEDKDKSSDKKSYKSSSRDKDKEIKHSKSKERDKKDNKDKEHKTSKEKEHKDSKEKEQKDGKDKEHKNSKEKEHKDSKKNEHKDKKDKEHRESKDKDRKDKSTAHKNKHRSKSSDDNHKRSKHSSSKKTEKHSDSKSSRSESKHKENRSKEKEKKHKSKHDEDKKKSISIEVSDDDFDATENGHDDDDDDYDFSDDDEETIALECKKIFEEYVHTEQPKNQEDNHKAEDISDEDYIPGKKRVSRTVDKDVKVVPRAPIKPDFKVGAAQAMSERLAKVREFHNSRQLQTPTPITNVENSLRTDISKNTLGSSNTSSKIRIAHVPYASNMLNAKKTMAPPQTKTVQPSTSATICQTVKKGIQRVAHIPNEKFIDRPGVLEPLASKIAANIRSIYLNMMIDECLKLYISATDAYARAQHEELNTSKKCSTVQIYKNSAVLAVSRLRKELQECNGVKKTGSSCSVLGSDSSNKGFAGSWSIESKNRKTGDNSQEFIGAKFYNNISKWVLSEEQLQSNGFPRPHSSGEKGRAIIYGQNKQHPPKGYLRTCCRCKKEYSVTKKGFAVVNEECIYHPNRIYRIRGEARYQCCSQDATSDGCCVAPSHVYEYVDFENLKGYVKTMPPERTMDDYGVYSLDCEMCYTTHGLDLTRVTVINSSCKVIYETLVRPLHPIVDYNTRYSGITEEQMANVRTTLLEVQATLLAMFNSKTILVGHSLESDFKALKLIHDTVVDTSVLFPHKMGPPYKRALRNLSSEHLKKIIQNSVDGHDSAEDAMVCMELLYYKLKEDLKTR